MMFFEAAFATDQSSDLPFSRSVLGRKQPVGDFNDKSIGPTVQKFHSPFSNNIPDYRRAPFDLPKPSGGRLGKPGLISNLILNIDMPYGNRELEKMIEARPAMGKLIQKDDKLWLWLGARLGGGAIGRKIAIEDFSEAPYGSLSQYHIDGDSAIIRLRSKDQSGNIISPQRLWPAVIFETFNMTHDAEQKAMYAQVIDGRLTREQFIEGCTRAEYKAVKETADFYRDFYYPYILENSYRASPHQWFVEAPDTYEAWIKQYTYLQGYPFDSYGAYFDDKVAPYLKRKAEAEANTKVATSSPSSTMNDEPTPPCCESKLGDTPVSIGVVFDQKSAGAYLGVAKLSKNWHKVPAWCVGRWKVGKATARSLPDGEAHEYNAACEGIYGYYADNTGQVWECDNASLWLEAKLDNDICHTYMISRTPTEANNEHCGFVSRSVLIYVNKVNGKIILVRHETSEENLTPISDGKIKCVSHEEFFENDDKKATEVELVNEKIRIGGLVEDRTTATPLGKNLFKLFSQYLRDHGLADRIPKGASK